LIKIIRVKLSLEEEKLILKEENKMMNLKKFILMISPPLA